MPEKHAVGDSEGEALSEGERVGETVTEGDGEVEALSDERVEVLTLSVGEGEERAEMLSCSDMLDVTLSVGDAVTDNEPLCVVEVLGEREAAAERDGDRLKDELPLMLDEEVDERDGRTETVPVMLTVVVLDKLGDVLGERVLVEHALLLGDRDGDSDEHAVEETQVLADAQ